MAKVTIVMTYWNRKPQLINTLRSIEKYGHDVKIIIVDDASTNGDDILCLQNDNVRVITMKNKTWINPCIPFNTGFSQVDTEVVILQNAECMHNGDVVGHVLNNIGKNIYLNYSALSISDSMTKEVSAGGDVADIVAPYMDKAFDANSWIGWYNHPKYRDKMYHFCSAIMREDLYDLGGFDERFADGLAYDDDEFIQRVIKKRMDVRIIRHPFVVHQFHEKFQPDGAEQLMGINRDRFKKACTQNEYDVKKYNKIYL